MNGTDEVTSLGQQLESLLAGVVHDIQREGDMIRGVGEAVDIIKDLRRQLWDKLHELDRDGREYALALLGRNVPPVALIAEGDKKPIAPPEPNPDAGNGLARIAAMLAPATLNGKPNTILQRAARK